MARPLLVWFRNDLRLHDHEPLSYALSQERPIIPLYCVDPRHFDTVWWDLPKTGPFRARFLLESLHDLRSSLEAKGSSLVVRDGSPGATLTYDMSRASKAVYRAVQINPTAYESHRSQKTGPQ